MSLFWVYKRVKKGIFLNKHTNRQANKQTLDSALNINDIDARPVFGGTSVPMQAGVH